MTEGRHTTEFAGHCPADNFLAGMADGYLLPGEREHVEHHLLACDVCRRLVATLAAAFVTLTVSEAAALTRALALIEEIVSGALAQRVRLRAVVGANNDLHFDTHALPAPPLGRQGTWERAHDWAAYVL